jgi:hypothetical protein
LHREIVHLKNPEFATTAMTFSLRVEREWRQDWPREMVAVWVKA